jgi:tetratricopeptide (TPR) repeat protein
MKRNLTTKIDDFLLESTSNDDLNNYAKKNNISPSELEFEIELNRAINNSILEEEILDLRNNIREMIEMEQNEKLPVAFNLTKHLDTDKPEVFDSVKNQDIVGNTMEKIHITNHNKAITEEIHRTQVDEVLESIQNKHTSDTLEYWPEIETAVNESDVLSLRNSIQNLFKENQEIMAATINETVSETELAAAILEKDVMDLRTNISSIIHENSSTDVDANNIELTKQIEGAIKEEHIMELRQSIREVIVSEESRNQNATFTLIRGIKPKRLVQSVAAVAAVFLLGFFLVNQTSTSYESIYSNQYTPYDASTIFRTNTTSNDMVNHALELYEEAKYTESLFALNEILATYPNKPQINFYAGLNHQALGEYQKAIASYQKVLSHNDNLFMEQSTWYMALCYLKTKNKKEAETLLSSIEKQNGFFSKNAKDILKKIK